jgi:hypothetical protein
VPAPHGQTLALALLEVAATHDGPARVAREYLPARVDLVVEVREADDACETTAEADEKLEPPRIDVVAIETDVPPARGHQPRPRLSVVEHRLRRSRRVMVDAPRHKYHEHAIAPRDRSLYDLAVIRCARHDRDPSLELGELAHAPLAAHADHLVPPDPARAGPCTSRAFQTHRRCRPSRDASTTPLARGSRSQQALEQLV